MQYIYYKITSVHTKRLCADFSFPWPGLSLRERNNFTRLCYKKHLIAHMYCIYEFSTYKITSFSKERALLEKDQTQLHFEFLTVTICVACVADV